jgi:hypothetical protein
MSLSPSLCVAPLQVGSVSPEHPELCERCLPVVSKLGFKLPGAAEKVAAAV